MSNFNLEQYVAQGCTRADFIDQKVAAGFTTLIAQGAPIVFLVNQITDKDTWDKEINGFKYMMYMYGILPCGTKTCVVINDAPVYFDILCPDEATSLLITGELMSKNIGYIRREFIELYKLHGFQKQRSRFARLFFSSLLERGRALKVLAHMQTASDDPDGYSLLLARRYLFNTTGWNRVSSYTSAIGVNSDSTCSITLKVSIDNFKKITSKMSGGFSSTLKTMMSKVRTMVMSWDIETEKTDGTIDVPRAEDKNWKLICVCANFYWQYSREPLAQVCFGAYGYTRPDGANDGKQPPQSRDDKIVIVHCKDQLEILKGFISMLGKMRPDIIMAFNGSSFDWALLREAIHSAGLSLELYKHLSAAPLREYGKYKDTDASVYNYCYEKNIKMKIDADNSHTLPVVLKVPGVLDVDLLPVLMKLNPREDTPKHMMSLNTFLKTYKLPAKNDMPYERMFAIVERQTALDAATGLSHQHGSLSDCHCAAINNVLVKDSPKCCKIMPLLDTAVLRRHDTQDESRLPYAPNDTMCGIKCCICSDLRARNKRELYDIYAYCTADCQALQNLACKCSIIDDKRQLASMSCVPLYQGFYRADGSKVRNLIGLYCNKFGKAFSNRRSDKKDSQKEFYPGGWVPAPDSGVNLRRPVSGQDFNSLYPSLMMAYNLSADTIVKDPQQARQLEIEGYSLHAIGPFRYEIGTEKGKPTNQICTGSGWTVRHNGIHRPPRAADQHEHRAADSLPPGAVAAQSPALTPKQRGDLNIVDHYDKYYRARDAATGEQREWLAAPNELRPHKAEVLWKPVYGRERLPGESMGIFAYIVKGLFDKRVPLKKEFVSLSSQLEKLALAKTNGETVSHELEEDLTFRKNQVDSKQKALKVLTNTFYGESGNFRSPIYELLVAAGITTAGQRNLRFIRDIVIDLGYKVMYGDTDSIYLSCPEPMFKEVDEEYLNDVNRAGEDTEAKVAARKKYWTAMVAITMKDMEDLTFKIHEWLIRDNGTLFLKMGYEEVGFPTSFCGKKKYFMIPHLHSINFDNYDLFIRGIGVIQQGVSKLTKEIGMGCMRDILSYRNDLSMMEIVTKYIRQYYSATWDVNMFISTAKYKPLKNNVPVHRFVERMTERWSELPPTDPMRHLYTPPQSGEKFSFVIVRRYNLFDEITGHKIDLGKGDRMEYLSVYLESQREGSMLPKMEIDLDWYMESSILGLLSRFICYMFAAQVTCADLGDREQYKKYDGKINDLAYRHLRSICDEITGNNPEKIRKQGTKYRAIHKKTVKMINDIAQDEFGGASSVLIDLGSRRIPADGVLSHLEEYRNRLVCDFDGAQEANDLLNGLLKKYDIYELISIYYPSTARASSILTRRIIYTRDEQARCAGEIAKLSTGLHTLMVKYNKNLLKVVTNLRNDTGELVGEVQTDKYTEAEKELLRRVAALVDRWLAAYRCHCITAEFIKLITTKKAADCNYYNPAPVINKLVDDLTDIDISGAMKSVW